MDHTYQAADLFLSGSNCAQAVLLAYQDLTGLDPELAAKISSSFGGGMGRLREVQTIHVCTHTCALFIRVQSEGSGLRIGG